MNLMAVYAVKPKNKCANLRNMFYSPYTMYVGRNNSYTHTHTELSNKSRHEGVCQNKYTKIMTAQLEKEKPHSCSIIHLKNKLIKPLVLGLLISNCKRLQHFMCLKSASSSGILNKGFNDT